MNRDERGGALVLCLALLALVGMAGIYLLGAAERVQGAVLRQQEARTKEVTEAARVAHLLNEIALNNRLILSSLALAGDSWMEAARWGVQLSLTTPYWEPSHWRVVRAGGTTFNSEDPLIAPFAALSRRAARAFLAAQALAERNQELVRSLASWAPRLSRALAPTTPQAAFCMALALTRDGAPQNLIPFSLPFPFLVPYPREQVCRARMRSLPFLEMIDFQAEMSAWKAGNPKFGVTLPQGASGAGLSAELEPLARASRDIAPPPAGEFGKSPLPPLRQHSQSALTHRDLRATCDSAPITSARQWEKLARCGVSLRSLQKAFLSPGWTPYLVRLR